MVMKYGVFIISAARVRVKWKTLRGGDVVGVRGVERRPGDRGCAVAHVHERIRGAVARCGDGDWVFAAHHERSSVHRVGHAG